MSDTETSVLAVKTKQAAQRLSVTPMTIRRLVERGQHLAISPIPLPSIAVP
jgi:hypothetical protein